MCALVAQWIERLVAVQKVAGPIPAERTEKTPGRGFYRARSKRTISLASGIGRRNGFPSQENREAVPNPSRATARREVKEIPAT